MIKKISTRLATAFFLALFFFGNQTASGEKLRVALPTKSLTFLNFYVGETLGAYQSEGLEVSLEHITPRVGIAGMLSGEMDYTGAIGSARKRGCPMVRDRCSTSARWMRARRS